MKKIFKELYQAETEDSIDKIINQYPKIFSQENWHPYGNNQSNYGVVENQQANPIAALVEKITNSIDAVLMKCCYLKNIDPKSEQAPQSISKAVDQFFPDNKNWDLSKNISLQAEEIQILAHGPKKNTSLIIYDNGEGQHPKDFENTLLSLLKGNKNEIPFVQGKYNMGGSGAIVFCGKKRYQLIGSKKYDNTGDFGWTLVRKHPLKEDEKVKSTWYEYVRINNEIASFPIESIDLGLKGREFTTGTVIKLYSYSLPTGSRSVISRDLNRSINEYLFEPALPIYTIDNAQRYPDDRNLERYLYGLKRRLDNNEKYIYKQFSEQYEDSEIGKFKINCYVFNFLIDKKNSKESIETIKREFFKNNMSVLFSLNGQVHGSFTSEFISVALKESFLKKHLLLHIDCSNLEQNFRSELFMASRDRMKTSEETQLLRKKIVEILNKSQLKEISKEFKSKITPSSDDSNNLIKEISKNLPLNNPELTQLIKQTFNLDSVTNNKTNSKKEFTKPKKKTEVAPFNPKRFPTSFKINTKQEENAIPMVQLPMGNEKIITFNTDVEDSYFDRIDEPGELQIALLDYKNNTSSGGGNGVSPGKIDGVISVSKSSPSSGIIRIHTKAKKHLNVGDSIKIKATLTSPNGNIEQVFLVKITDKNKQDKKPKKENQENLGLPQLIQVQKELTEGFEGKTWSSLDSVGINFDTKTVMYPFVNGDQLESIYINMDSGVLKKFLSKLKNENGISAAKKRYLSTVYFHTLFLYMISKHRKYKIQRDDKVDTDLQDYLQDIFNNHYSAFLLNFEMTDLLTILAE